MITAARFRAEASAAAAAAASASRLARCSRPHFIRNTHRRAAIWSLMTSSRSREYCPRASIPRTCACTSVAAFACARASASAIFAASSAASFSSRSDSRRFHFRRSAHRRTAI